MTFLSLKENRTHCRVSLPLTPPSPYTNNKHHLMKLKSFIKFLITGVFLYRCSSDNLRSRGGLCEKRQYNIVNLHGEYTVDPTVLRPLVSRSFCCWLRLPQGRYKSGNGENRNGHYKQTARHKSFALWFRKLYLYAVQCESCVRRGACPKR